MAKYKLLTKEGYENTAWIIHQIFDESFKQIGALYSVKELVEEYPNDWELIK